MTQIQQEEQRLALELLISTGVFTVIGSGFVLARLYVRAKLLKSVRWDDYLILLAMLLAIGLYVVLFTVAKYIRVLDQGTVAINHAYWKYNHIEIGVCAGQNLFSRMSILLAYYRFTPREISSSYSIWFLNTTFALTLLTSIGAQLVAMMPCWPPQVIHFSQAFFDERRKGTIACMTQEQIICVMSVVGIITDILLFVLPFALLSHVQLRKSVRRHLYVIFGFGFGVLLIGIIRIPFLVQLWPGPNWNPRTDPDQTTGSLSAMVHTWIITFAESNYFMVAASLPTLAPLWRELGGYWSSHVGSKVSLSVSSMRKPSWSIGAVRKGSWSRMLSISHAPRSPAPDAAAGTYGLEERYGIGVAIGYGADAGMEARQGNGGGYGGNGRSHETNKFGAGRRGGGNNDRGLYPGRAPTPEELDQMEFHKIPV